MLVVLIRSRKWNIKREEVLKWKYKNLEEIAEKIDKDKDFRKAVTSKLGITEEFVREYIVNFIKNIFGYEGIEGYRVVFSWRDNSGILEKKPTITLGEFLREDNGISKVTYTDIGLICHDFTYGEDLASEVRNDFSNLEFEAYKKNNERKIHNCRSILLISFNTFQ